MRPDRTEQADSARRVATALWFEKAAKPVLRTEGLSEPGEHEVTVRCLYSGISRGTENLVFLGKVPESEHQRMRGPNMGGGFPFPVKYGYAAVGRIETGPPELKNRNVFCLHPHQDIFVLPIDEITLLPDKLPAHRAILAANMETALNVVWDAGIQPGDRVAIFGAGVVGALAAFIAHQIIGTETILIDHAADRAGLAAGLGLHFVEAAALHGEFDVLINASGSDAALATAIDHAGTEARIVEASWYGDKPASIRLGGAFHSRRLQIISSQVGAVAALRRPRWSLARRLGKALDLLADPRLETLISGETAFADIVDAYPAILAAPGTLCHRIRY